MTNPLLKVEDLRVWFPKDTSFFGKPLSYVKAVEGVSFEINAGETLGLVGESGSGKSTTGFAVVAALRPHSGSIHFSPDGNKVHRIDQLSQRQMRPLRQHLQLIFQDPFSSLNPRMTVYRLISEPLKVYKIGTEADRRKRVRELMDEVGLNPEFVNRYPHAFSGGQRQRIVIARALALKPRLIICDEPVSALDVSVQAQILNLLMDLKERHNLSYIFIGHDLEVIRHIADRVAVMYAGRLVEEGPASDVLGNPRHPYTIGLLASSPKPDPDYKSSHTALRGEIPDPSNLPSGCVFHPRCPQVQERCSRQIPERVFLSERHSVRCVLHQQ